MVHGQSGKRSDDGHATASLPVPPGWIEEPDPGSRCPTCLPMAAGPRGSQHTDMDGGPRPPPLLASGFRPHTEGGPALDACRPISSDRACRARSEGRRVAARPAPDGQGQADRPAQRVRPRRPVVARPDGPHRRGRCRRSSRSSGTTTSPRAIRTRRSCCARTGCCASTAWAPSGACCGRSRATRRCSSSSRSPTPTRTRRTRTTPASSWSSSRSRPATTSATSARPPAR